jgi:GNAT superfamily N-acetyltransferase
MSECVPKIEYWPENAITENEDRLLREVLSTCYKGPDDWMFPTQRYWQEPPQHRWWIRGPAGAIISQIAVHDKIIGSPIGDLRIGGVGLVCTHPDHRRKGYVRLLLTEALEWMKRDGMSFSLLFAAVDAYSSSGYITVNNPFHQFDFRTKEWVTKLMPKAMAAPLAGISWPEGEIDLRGMEF